MGNTLERPSSSLRRPATQLRITAGEPSGFLHVKIAIAEIESHCTLAHSDEPYPGKAKHLLALETSLRSNIRLLKRWNVDESLNFGSRSWAAEKLPVLEDFLIKTVELLKPGAAIEAGSEESIIPPASSSFSPVEPRIQPLLRFDMAVSAGSVIELPPLVPGQSRFKEMFDD